MANCTNCKKDVVPSITIDGRAGAVHVCPSCGQQLEVSAVAAMPVASVSDTKIRVPLASPSQGGRVAALALTNLPAAIRARKKELRANIKRDQRELAQLESLTKPSKRTATVTAIKRSAS
jgi:hypothetical protein